MNYRIAFCGLGSIAKRHLKNVCTFLESRGISATIDLYRSSIKPLPEDCAHLVDKELLFSDPIVEDYDIVFITNPTSLHYETLKRFKNHTRSFFIEKPIFDTTDIDDSLLAELKDITCYVACPLRYNPALQYVHNSIPLDKVFSARAICSSYLPDWRPSQDYRQCYSAHRDMGGGVGIDLIHEWDYLTNFFGMPKVCYSIQEKVSNLEIDSDDIAIYIAKTESTTIELHLDYFGRKSLRTLELFLPEETILCDIYGATITYMKKGKTLSFDSERNAFQMKEIEHFFSIINNEINNDSTAEHAFNVLKLALGL